MLFCLLLVPTCVMAQSTIGYTNETASRNNIFRYTSNTDQRLAMRLSVDKLKALKGQTIKAIRMAFGSKNATGGQATIFLTKALDATPLCQETVTISSTNKLTEFTLSKPYTITGEEQELFVGCSLEIAANYGPFSSDFSQDIKGVFFAYGNGGWNDIYGMGYGCPNIEIVTSETVSLTDVCLKPFSEDGYVKVGTPLSYKLQIQNFGTTEINSLDAVVRVGNGEEKRLSLTGLTIAPRKTYDLTVEGIQASTSGQQDISVSLTQLNGKADEEQSDNIRTASAYFYPADMQRNVLVEVFTGQTCTNCPSAHTALASAITQTPEVHVVEIAHHAGFVTDIFSMKEDWTLTGLYNNSTYAPAVMFNRTAFGEASTPVGECGSASTVRGQLKRADEEHPYVSINLNSQYDETTREVKLTCQFYTHEQMPGDDLRYSIWLVQDSLVAKQNGASADYVHNAVSRGTLTGSAWGEKASFIPGETLTVEKTFTLPSIIHSTSYEKEDGKNAIPTVLKDMKLVVFVHQQSGNDVNACRVFNCAEVEVSKVPETPVQTMRLLKRQTYYGDAQGVEQDTTATRTIDYCYDASNKVLRKIETSKETKIDHWGLTHYYINDYDAQGNMVRTHSLQYGTFDYDELGWFAAKDTITYDYDAQNRLIRETHPLKYYTYAYDEANRLVERATWNVNSITYTASNDLVEKYEGFNAQGNPTQVKATSPTGKEWNEYTGYYTYDAEGHLVETKHYTNETPSVLKFAEYWVYQDGILAEHRLPTVYGDGEEVENEKEVFTPVDGNKDMIEHSVYLYNEDGTWSKMAGSRCIDEYVYLAPGSAPTLTVTASDSEQLNTVVLEVSNATTNQVMFYRSGLAIATTPYNGKATAEDSEVKNGTYEYMAMDGARITNLVTYTHHTNLPAVSNVHYISSRQDETGSTFVTIGWDNSMSDSRLGFICNSVFFENMRSEEVSTDDPSVNSLEVEFGMETKKELYVQTRYRLGRANTASVLIDLNNLSDAVKGLDTRSASPLYDLQGRKVNQPSKGIYIGHNKKLYLP